MLFLKLFHQVVHIFTFELASSEVSEHLADLGQLAAPGQGGKHSILLLLGKLPSLPVLLEILLGDLVATVLCLCYGHNVAAIDLYF